MIRKTPVRLLIVDDHAAFRSTVRQMFDTSTTEILEASSGEEAVQRCGEWKPDWVIMDLRMPGMGGIAATGAIREKLPAARVIVISQFTETEFCEQARRAGAVAFVPKDDIAQLPEIIRGHMG